MDPTTIMAIICSGVVFAGWLFLPHSPTRVKPDLVVSDVVVSEERQPVRVSA
jgi:hypothetical protein